MLISACKKTLIFLSWLEIVKDKVFEVFESKEFTFRQ